MSMRNRGRPPRAGRAASTSSRCDHDPGRPGAADHDLGPAQLVAQRSRRGPRGRRGPPPAPPPARSVVRPSTVARAPPRTRCRAASSLILPAPTSSTCRSRSSPKIFRASSTATEETETALLADAGLRARPLGRGHRAVAQRVQDRPQRSRPLRQLVGLLHLAQDLRLADHHRVEAGRHAEGVAHRGLALEPVEVGFELAEARGHGARPEASASGWARGSSARP